MNIKLFFDAIIKLSLGIFLIGALIFIPAGTIYFWNAWLLMGILFIPMFIVGIIMMIKNPELLKKRLNIKEKQGKQREVVALSGLMFLTGFIVAGLNYRYGWNTLPNIFVISSSVIFIISYILYAEVLRENTYLSRVIEVQENQKVIDTGLYSVVRHPMYSITIIMFLSMPIILGAIYSFLIFLVYPLLIEVLEKELKGYKEYKEKVKYKLIPFIW